MKSIRSQLILTLVVCLSILFAAASTALYLYARDALETQFDEALTTRILSFTEMAEARTEGDTVFYELEFDEFPLPEYQPSADAEYYEVWRRDGSVLTRSASLNEADLPRIAADGAPPTLDDVALPDGRRGRAVALWFSPLVESDDETPAIDGSGPVSRLYMMMARSRENLDAALLGLLAGFGAMWGLLVVGLILTIRWSVGQGLQPLEKIAHDATGIESTNLSHRFRTDNLPRELDPIGQRLNELLGRLEGAFQRERRFNADVAHELRTPIAELRILAEVALKKISTSEADPSQGEYFNDVLDIAVQMESMVTVLLSLVRSESGRLDVRREPVDLVALIERGAAPFRAEVDDKKIAIELTLPESAVVESDRTLVSSIVTNLFSNAVGHTPAGGSIWCELVARSGARTFTLRNTNDQLVEEDLDHLLEPFWQKDPSRTQATRNGLGLSIVAAYADALGLRLEISLPTEGLFEIALLFPPPGDQPA